MLRWLCYQDFKDTFVCNTQQETIVWNTFARCVIRISKILLYAIHNPCRSIWSARWVVLSGFQRYFCMQYTTNWHFLRLRALLCYQDFKDTFVCNTQQLPKHRSHENSCVIRISKILLYAIHNSSILTMVSLNVVLSGFQRYFCMQYTTGWPIPTNSRCCVIRISKILLYAIHNTKPNLKFNDYVVLSGFQRYFCMQYTTW